LDPSYLIRSLPPVSNVDFTSVFSLSSPPPRPCFGMAGGKKNKPSNAMLQRMVTLEKKLGGVLAGRVNKQKLHKQISAKSHTKKAGHRGRHIDGKNYTATDGLNRSRVVTNNSAIEDHFSRRREKIADINGSTSAFAIQQALYLNPGNSVLFPIFAQIAAVYEEFRTHHLRFTLETEAYTASGTSQSAGIACMATNADPDDSQFASLTEMENYYGSTKGPPYATVMVHDVLAAHRGRKGGNRQGGDLALNNYFVYPSANLSAPSSSTSKFYDIGLFQLAVANMVGSGIIGELYVEYEFTMIRPKQAAPGSVLSALVAHIEEGVAGTATASSSQFLGTTGGVLRSGSTLKSVMTKNTFTIPVAGTYLVSVSWYGSVTTVATLSPGANIVNTPTLLLGGGDGSLSSVSSSVATGLWIFTVTASGSAAANTITISGLSNLAAGNADIFISQIPSGLLLPKPRLVRGDGSSSSGLSYQQLDRMYAKLCELGVITDDDSPVTVTGDDGIVRISQPDHDRQLGISTSAPPSSAGFSKLLGLGRK
jgi:hypothetical protein